METTTFEMKSGSNIPMMIVDDDLRVLSVNDAFRMTIAGMHEPNTAMMAGDAVRCLFADQPSGCGQTRHCNSCSIRYVVEAVKLTGEKQINRPAYIERMDGMHCFFITAFRDERGIVVELNDQPD